MKKLRIDVRGLGARMQRWKTRSGDTERPRQCTYDESEQSPRIAKCPLVHVLVTSNRL